jgi:UMP-CMP kinase
MIDRIMERSKTSGRNDDNLETLTKRFETFEKETLPIVDLYE